MLIAALADPVTRGSALAALERWRWPVALILAVFVLLIFLRNLPTTLIVAVILYAVGTGPVKGFAVTLSVGIVTSMFTAIIGTRSVINLIYGGRRVEKLAV